ncbi:SDR family NAD(P)-dependent oxidoreductase [Halomarina oriensis]|uniref:Glucose 1-dehydrogenase n=1 Tax=Halomarina oriensis TaxID=671145 RepID=A0A6B0GHI5_9EURY|nr:glucose 1-dehydrogenase [Halomarina oriensis]MWG33397.1 glucose 1-dehydrogenase [Halomarina oriensis]
MGLLSGQLAVVTGAGRGQGRAEAELFADHGASVVVADVDTENAERVVASIRDGGGEAVAVTLDVSEEAGWEALVRTVEADYGALDCLVNNAGVARSESITDETVDGWQHVVDVDLRGVWLGMKHAIPLLRANGGGSIVNVSSIYGVRGGAGDSAAYHAAKGGVTVLTKNAAVGYGPEGIRTNSLHPGYMRRPMGPGADEPEADGDENAAPSHGPPVEAVPLGRFGRSSEVASAALFLASDLASYVNGVELYVDGGYLAA